MAQLYFSLVTTAGRIKLAASAAGGPPVTITHFAIGDGNGADTNPTSASAALVREVWRTGVESVQVDPLNPAAVLVTAIIPTNQGGWWMREFGIFDSAGTMIAVAKPVSQYKPTAAEGQLEDIRYEFQIVIGETANVTLLVDPSVLMASRAWVESRKTPLNRLQVTPWVPVISMTLSDPAGTPAVGDTYLVPAVATGAWAGQGGKLAEWTGTAWAIFATPNGHGVSLPDGRVFERVAGTYVEKIALEVQTGKWCYGVAGGTGNAITVALTPAPPALVEGMLARIKIAAGNTTAVTVNANGLGVKPLRRSDGADLQQGELAVGQVIEVVYDGASWQLVNFSGGERTRRRAFTGLWSQSLADGVLTKITAFTDLDRDLASTAFTGGVLTVAAGDAGLWEFIFSAVSPNSNLEMFAAISQSTTGSGAISYNAAQTYNGAPGTTASIIVRLNVGDNISFTVRQISGAARTFSGRVSMCRIGG